MQVTTFYRPSGERELDPIRLEAGSLIFASSSLPDGLFSKRE
jgi:hypothetical protein